MLVAEALESNRLVFVDEMGANTSLAPLHGWSRVGASGRAFRCRATLREEHDAVGEHEFGGYRAYPGGARRHDQGGVRGVVRGAGTGAPRLRAGQEVVVMDNLSAHKGEEVRELVEERGCQVLFLAPYSSPDLNPVEESL